MQLPGIKFQGEGRVIANFAWQHLKAATIFRDHLIRLESDNIGQPFGSFFVEIRSYGSACIMSAAASLEALINELFIAHNSPLRNQLADFEREFWGQNGIEGMRPFLKKYQLALEMLGKPLFTQHEAPYRDASTLIGLRNALVHHKPTWDESRRRDDLVQALDGKFTLSPFPGAGADFVSEKCMSAGCARWVVSTCLALIDEFDSRTNLDPGKMAGFKKLNSP